MLKTLLVLAGTVAVATACDVCTGTGDVEMVRNVRRMQPDAKDAVTKPKGPLEWGQINFLHTTDTHGWLEGHVKERNYGADWGDYVSFVRHMRYKARSLDVDLLVVDTGDLHDGTGLADAPALLPGGVDGQVTDPMFLNLDYDLLTIGNHELYVSDTAYETFQTIAKGYGKRYLTSNVQIRDPKDGKFKDVGYKYRYFTTTRGVRIMAFGVLFDFTGNSNASIVTPAATMVQQQWFKDAIARDDIDLFVVLGHNAIHGGGSTFPIVHKAIRAIQKDTPIQIFGGHTHIRDFTSYDNSTTALESGRYCETLGWLSINNLKSGNAARKPANVPLASRPAINGTTPTDSTLLYSRRYLDWNRLTFTYHANNVKPTDFDVPRGKAVTAKITEERARLNLTTRYGCAPQSYCLQCVPQIHNSSIFPLVQTALATTVVQKARIDKSRMIIINTGSLRFDIVQGPFTYDDSFIVSPFKDSFEYIKDVPYKYAKQVLDMLNKGPHQKRQRDSFTESLKPRVADACPLDDMKTLTERATGMVQERKITKRQEIVVPGYTTLDYFGSDGDDTPHSSIPNYYVDNDLLATANFPADKTDPETVDLIFLDFITSYIIGALTNAGVNYTTADVDYYMPKEFTTNSYLPAFAEIAWKDGSC